MQWTLVLGLAFRNLFRNKKRNLISSVAIIVGVIVLILGDGLIDGLDEITIRSTEENISGHVIIRTRDYPSDGRNFPINEEKTRIPDEALLAQLQTDQVKAWTSRLWFRARFIKLGTAEDQKKAEKSGEAFPENSIKVISYQPQTELSVFPRKLWTISGAWPANENEIAVGKTLAKLLDLEEKDTATLQVRTRPEGQNARNYTISGIVDTGILALDANTAWIPYDHAEKLVFHHGAVSHISLNLSGGRNQAKAYVDNFKSDTWMASTATQEVKDFLAINQFRRKAMGFMSFILMAIAATGICNTVIMAAYERVAEIGVLRAMGMQKSGIRLLFIAEGLAMGLIAGIVGAIVGGGLNWHLSQVGFDISSKADAMGEMPFPTLLYTLFSWGPVFQAILFGVLVSVLASLWPALQSVRINPADAVREG